MSVILSNPSIKFKIPLKSPAKTTKKSTISARLDNSQEQQQLNLSILRFTFGIPGFDESYLPRWIGYGFGSLLILNHFAFSGSLTPAQLRTEALGLSLAGFSVTLPYLGKFLKGANLMDRATLPESAEQIFVMSQNVSDTLKEDLAWATYVLLRNTNSVSVLISIRGELCVRGYWNSPDSVLKGQVLEWFERQIEKIGLSDLEDSLYFPQSADGEFWEMLPKGTSSLFVQPLIRASDPDAEEMGNIEGFVLLASSAKYAYSDKDRAWIKAVANKFIDLTKVGEVVGNLDCIWRWEILCIKAISSSSCLHAQVEGGSNGSLLQENRSYGQSRCYQTTLTRIQQNEEQK